MNEEQKNKLKELKNQMTEKEKQQRLQKNVLYQECLEALEVYEVLENEDVVQEIIHLISLPSVEKHPYKDVIDLKDDEQYYIVWDEMTLPVVLSSGRRIKENWDDVVAVSFETYFIASSTKTVIGVK